MAKLEGAGHFRKEVAKFQISFSNSMVEALFRSLKHNYLFHQKITSRASLAKHAAFWFKEHNERVPHSAFEGQTPGEIYRSSWSADASIKIFIRQEEALKLRIQENQKVFCEQCAVNE